MECFYSQESCDHFYISFQSHRIMVKRSIDPHDFQDTPLTAILKERGWKSFFTLQGFYYPYWFTCFMWTCILFLPVAPFGWPCLVSPFISPFCPLGVYSAYLYFMRVFLPLFQRFNLSHLEASFTSNFVIWCSLWASHVYFFGFLLLSLFFLSLIPSYRDLSIDCLFHPRHPI